MKDAKHLFRLAAVFVAGIIMFVVVRGLLVPRSFGQYGHFRGDAIGDIKALPIAYAGHEVCEACHSEVLDMKEKGKHAHVACESCHGPLAKHADDPTSVKPDTLDTKVLCARCHEAVSAKPRHFPQVVSAEHSAGLACNECHKPHSPALGSGEKTPGGKK